MKQIFPYTYILMFFILFSNCKNNSLGTGETTGNQEYTVLTENQIKDFNQTINVDKNEYQKKENSVFSDICNQLKNDYEVLVNKINSNTENKELIAELISWTKEPNHLDCLENNQNYNSVIEELNASL